MAKMQAPSRPEGVPPPSHPGLTFAGWIDNGDDQPATLFEVSEPDREGMAARLPDDARVLFRALPGWIQDEMSRTWFFNGKPKPFSTNVIAEEVKRYTAFRADPRLCPDSHKRYLCDEEPS